MPKKYWYVILTYLLMQLSGIVVAPLIKLLNIDPVMASVFWSLFSFLAGLVIILFLLREDMKQGSERGASNIGTIIMWAILGVFLAYIAQYVAVMIETFVFDIKPGSENTSNIMEIARAAPIFILIPAIIAPILEEIIFRKIIFGSIYKRTNFIIAALASALVFGVVHGDPLHMLTYSAMGFVFAFLYVKTKRIIVPIIAHMAMNTITVILQFNLTPEDIEKMQEQMKQLQTIIGG